MKNKNSNASRWLLVSLFSVLGLGLLTGSASAQEEEPALPAAQAQQIGDNNVVVEQETTVKSGDSVAGSQVVGVVGGSPTIQGQNSSSGATATSGNVTASNELTAQVGPSATTTAAPAPENDIVILSSHTGSGAQAQQIGDNNVVVSQETNVSSGDCVAGSTVTGVVGSDAVIQNQNSSTDASCTTGDVTATNTLNVNVGPVAVVLPPPPPPEPEADLAVTKEFVSNAGATLTYEVEVSHAGGDPAEGVVLTDTLPANATFVSVTAPAGWSCTDPGVGNTGDVVCTKDDGPMLEGETAVFEVVVQANAGSPSGTEFTNTAAVSSDTSDPDSGNNTDDATFTRP